MPSFFLLLLMSLSIASTTPKTHAPRSAKPHSASTQPPVPEPASVAKEVALAPDTSALTPEAAVLVAKLEAATDGLQMPSETDAPFRVVFWASQKPALTPAEIAVLAEQEADAVIEIQTVETLFANAALVEDWMKDDEKATALRFAKLVETLKAELENPQVYLMGERERTVVIVGKVRGGFGGVITLVVET